MQAETIYAPSKSFTARVKRRITPLMAQRRLPVNLEKPIVSFTFDDCPLSAITAGVRMLDKEGWTSTIYVASGLLNHVNHHGLHLSKADVQRLVRAGHEIGCHTFSHQDATAMSIEDVLADIARNQTVLQDMGVPPSRTFAYPFGQTHPDLKRRLQREYVVLRGITPGTHKRSVDLNQVKSYPLFSGADTDTLIQAISELSSQPGWLTLFTHDIARRPSPWGCTPEDFARVVSAVKASGAQVMSMIEAYSLIKDSSR